ncbi:MAG TPA: excinuclease ABC subunit C, partial [Chlorobaculum parvum]|nr:excinuclease ABC subunit C [Chlorobaculum parvum]
MKNRARPCLKYQVHRCSGPCTGSISREDYMIEVRKVKSFLEGRTFGVVKELEGAMKEAASRLEFERAALYRDQVDALKKVLEGQAVVLSSHS